MSHTPGPCPSSRIAPSGTASAPACSESIQVDFDGPPSGLSAALLVPTRSGLSNVRVSGRRRPTVNGGSPYIAFRTRTPLHQCGACSGRAQGRTHVSGRLTAASRAPLVPFAPRSGQRKQIVPGSAGSHHGTVGIRRQCRVRAFVLRDFDLPSRLTAGPSAVRARFDLVVRRCDTAPKRPATVACFIGGPPAAGGLAPPKKSDLPTWLVMACWFSRFRPQAKQRRPFPPLPLST